MPNLHNSGPDTLAELASIDYDLLPACLLATSGLTTPGSGLTLAAVSATGYVRLGTALYYVAQPAISVTVSSTVGNHWLALTTDTYSAIAGWTRRAGSHFVEQANATQPTAPDGCQLVSHIVVTGANITTVTALPSPPLSRQNANAVTITGGTAQLTALALGAGVGLSATAPLTFGPSAGHKTYWFESGSLAGSNLVAAGVSVSPSNLDQFVAAGGVLRWGTMGPTGTYTLGATLTGGDLAVLRDLAVTRYQALGPLPNDGTAQLRVGFDKSARFGLALAQQVSDVAGNASVVFYNVGGTVVGYIIASATTTTYATTSDGRLKTAVQALTGALETVRALRPVTFRWAADDTPGVGLVAQEVRDVIPEAVTGTPDGDLPMGLDLTKVVPYLTSAVQTLSQQVEALTARLAALEAA